MARGLSELQKTILKMAYRNRHRRHGSGDVRNREVLIEFYKFSFHSPSVNTTSGSPQIFYRTEIGINRYRSASVSVAKAFNRLDRRGLAIRKYNHGIILTEEGSRKAKVLLAGIGKRVI
jgi:hypothetical protein